MAEELREHEVRVKHKASNVEMVINKKLYHDSPDDYEIVDGEPGEKAAPPTFKQPKVSAAPTLTKRGDGPTKNKAKADA